MSENGSPPQDEIDDVEFERMLTRIHDGVVAATGRRRRRRRALIWSGIALPVVGLALTGALHPLGTVNIPLDNVPAHLAVHCYDFGDGTKPADSWDANDDAQTEAARRDPAAVCIALKKTSMVVPQLNAVAARETAAGARCTTVYATDGSRWRLETGGAGGSISGGPAPAPLPGAPAPAATPSSAPTADPGCALVTGFRFDFGPAPRLASCVLNDVEFNVYPLKDGETSAQLCDSKGLIAAN